jgi:pyruvate/2-oxoacid:ferredoxin oxidoreductase beta subunit
MQAALATIATEDGIPKEKFAVVSGIGCSSRFPYYVKTYGFHGIHGRAAAIATGVKTANPELSVWVATGDGDSLAIGGNHFIHAVRRNIDLTMMLFNNEIYGLTKGQYSPTTKLGKITKTSPFGTIEKPFKPGELAIGAGGTFFARSIDAEVALTRDLLVAGARHRGMAVIEALVNCVIFNDKTHARFAADKATRAENTILLRHGEKMLFGAARDRGLIFDNGQLRVVRLGEKLADGSAAAAGSGAADGSGAGAGSGAAGSAAAAGSGAGSAAATATATGGSGAAEAAGSAAAEGRVITEADILTHDAHAANPMIHFLLAGMSWPDYPVALGIIRQVEAPAYDGEVARQVKEVQASAKLKNVDDLLASGSTWQVR